MLVRDKDVALDLIDKRFKKIIIRDRDLHFSSLTFLWRIVKRIGVYVKTNFRYKPDLMMSHDFMMPLIGKLLRRKVLYFTEDDIHIIKLAARIGFPFADVILASESCYLGKYNSKKLAYKGYQKLAYIHPGYFSPDSDIVKKYIEPGKRYFIIRVVKLKAYHDVEHQVKGIDNKLLGELISRLEKYGEVLVSAERALPEVIGKQTKTIEPADMHHLMAFADLFISDSQTMSVECALMGTPNIRFHTYPVSFGYIDEIEKDYALTCTVNNAESLLEKMEEFVNDTGLKEKYSERRTKLLQDKIDVTSFLVDLLEHPETIKPTASSRD
jgi:predicted glycosyltransferase